jgi:hypothetical protein
MLRDGAVENGRWAGWEGRSGSVQDTSRTTWTSTAGGIKVISKAWLRGRMDVRRIRSGQASGQRNRTVPA